MKTQIRLLLIACAITTCGVVTSIPQEAVTNSSQTNVAAVAQRRDAIRPGIDNRVQFLARELNLTEEQQQKIRAILEEERVQMQNLRNETNMTPEERRAKVTEIRNATNNKIKSVLTPEQQTKFDQLPRGITRPPQGGPPTTTNSPRPQVERRRATNQQIDNIQTNLPSERPNRVERRIRQGTPAR